MYYECLFQGIEAHPLRENNIFEWSAKILGLKDTLWEGMLMLKSYTIMNIPLIGVAVGQLPLVVTWDK